MRRVGFSFLLPFLLFCSAISSGPTDIRRDLPVGVAMAQEGGVDPGQGETVITNPKIRQRQVTASVPDNLPPTTPILISPLNNSLITDNTPTFVWQASTDVTGMDHYAFYLDGVLLYDNLPLSGTTTVTYVYSFDPVNNEYRLTPINPVADGTHTWKVRAVDTTNNITDSVTWTFTSDSAAPTLVVTQIGDQAVTISAQDVSTIPLTPIILTENEPLLLGNGEPNSLIQTALIIPGDPIQYFTTTIGTNGQWSIQLGILPREVTMTLNFLITDAAGNISVLNGVEFRIAQKIIVFPPVNPTPSPSAAPTPSAATLPAPGTGPVESQPAPSPIISIPFTPPRETMYNVIQEIIETFPQSVRAALASLAPIVDQLAPISGLLVSVVVPLASTIAVATQFGGGISPTLLIKILQALGLIPVGKPQGFVFNSETDEGVPFAVLTFRSHDESTDFSIVETVVTDSEGVYKGIILPAGNYRIEIKQQDFHFPTSQSRPLHLGLPDFYRGEIFQLANKQEPLFLIPMDPLKLSLKKRWQIKGRLFLARLARQSTVALYPLLLLSGLLVIMYPTVWNWLIFGLYGLLAGRRILLWFRVPIISGQVLNKQGLPESKVIVRLSTVQENSLAAVLLTNDKGEFSFYGRPDAYQLSLQKKGLVWIKDDSPMSFYQVDARLERQHIVTELTSLSEIYQSMS